MKKQLKTPQLQLAFDGKTNTFLQCNDQSTANHYKSFNYSNCYSYKYNSNTFSWATA